MTIPEYDERIASLQNENDQLFDQLQKFHQSQLFEVDRTEIIVTGGFASSEDPKKKFWLRNEVIGFERHIVELNIAADNAKADAEDAQTRAAQAIQARKKAESDVVARDISIKELTTAKNQITSQLSDSNAKLEAANKDILSLRTGKAEQQKRAEKAEGDLLTAREQCSVLKAIEDQLQVRCQTLQSDLADLRDNPKIPPGYKAQVEQKAAEQKAEIELLEEECARLRQETSRLSSCLEGAQADLVKAASDHKDELAKSEQSAAEELGKIKAKLVEAEEEAAFSRALAAEEKIHREKIQRECFQREEESFKVQSMLAERLAEKPKQVSNTVYITSSKIPSAVKDGPVWDADLLKIFDSIDMDVTGFAPRALLCEQVEFLEKSDKLVKGLTDALNALPVIVVERDDFKVMIAKWRGIIPASGSPVKGTTTSGATTDSALLKLFDALDYDATGFVPRMDLVRTLQNKAATDHTLEPFVKCVSDTEAIIVDREDFVDLLNKRH